MKAGEQSAEDAAISRAPEGVSEQEMTGAWRVLIAKHGTKHRARYYHTGNDKRSIEALRKAMNDWYEYTRRTRRYDRSTLQS